MTVRKVHYIVQNGERIDCHMAAAKRLAEVAAWRGRALDEATNDLTTALRDLLTHHEQSCVGAGLDPESDTPQCAEYLAAKRLMELRDDGDPG